MPPKFKYNREEIINSAINLVREQGADALTARALAATLGSSSKPMFTLFCGMDEVRDCVIAAATELYNGYIAADMSGGEYPPYKASGMAYIRFAREEKELFKLLFMRDRSGEDIPKSFDGISHIIEIIMQNLGLDSKTAEQFHLEMWIFVHGIATMTATGYLEWDAELASDALSDMYDGLKMKFTKGE